MLSQKQKSYNGQVYEKAYKRLKLKRREKIILQRLLGFLLRNDKPFPFCINKLSELTGYSRSSIFESLNLLEKYRLILRLGYTTNMKYAKGSILKRIYSLVQISSKIKLRNNSTLVQKLDEILPASPVSGYKKTSLSLKPKEGGIFSIEEIQEKNWYLKNPGMPIKAEHQYLFVEQALE